MHSQLLPTPPRCPRWCDEHQEGSSWEVRPSAVTKTCCRTITVSYGNVDPVIVTLDRFASVEDGRLNTEEPRVRIEYAGTMPVELAELLADTLARVIEIAQEPDVAA